MEDTQLEERVELV